MQVQERPFPAPDTVGPKANTDAIDGVIRTDGDGRLESKRACTIEVMQVVRHYVAGAASAFVTLLLGARVTPRGLSVLVNRRKCAIRTFFAIGDKGAEGSLVSKVTNTDQGFCPITVATEEDVNAANLATRIANAIQGAAAMAHRREKNNGRLKEHKANALIARFASNLTVSVQEKKGGGSPPLQSSSPDCEVG